MYARDLALIGAGYWGRNLARNFNALGVLRTLCDSSKAALDSYGEDYSAVSRSCDAEAVFADGEIRKIAIAAPAMLHYQLVKAALQAGKDVYVEKPLCLDLKEAEELVALANSRKLILMVGHLLQYHPCITHLQQLVAEGALGRIQYITSNRLNLGKIRKEENALWSFAPHDVSVILSLVGDRLPDQIRCVGESYLTRGVADTTLTSFRFAGNVRAHIYVSWLNPFKEQKLTVVGAKGMVVFDDTKPWKEKLLMHREYLTWADGHMPVPTKLSGSFLDVPEKEPLQEECRHFVESCRTRTPPRTDGREGLRVLQVLKAAQCSLEREGHEVDPSAVSEYPKSDFFAHPTAIVDAGAEIGRGTKIWHFAHINARARIGADCIFGQNTFVADGVVVGNNVKVQNNVSIYTGTVIEDDVFLGPSCVLTNVSNPRSQINRHSLYEKIHIQRGATVGANATILCGLSLGRYCFVAAGAVVTKDVPDYALICGVPGRQLGWMSRHGHVLKKPDKRGIMTCPESGLRYRIGSKDKRPSRIGSLRSPRIYCIDLAEDAPLPAELAVAKLDYKQHKNATFEAARTVE